LFVGDVAEDSILLAARDLFPAARIEVLGPEAPRPRVRERMVRAAYLVVLADDKEVPRHVIEAFANSLPVVASSSFDGLIEPGRNGLLFTRNSPRELARRLAWAEAFPERMRQMGECAQADYQARFGADWTFPKLFGERRRYARAV
jgi:glycosyltransferase involved in cell wall biosynthesis